jgi:hypothetical protein
MMKDFSRGGSFLRMRDILKIFSENVRLSKSDFPKISILFEDIFKEIEAFF